MKAKHFFIGILLLCLLISTVSAAAGDTILFEQVNISKNVTQIWNNGTFRVYPVVQGVTSVDNIDQSYLTAAYNGAIGNASGDGSPNYRWAQNFSATKSQMTGITVNNGAIGGTPSGNLIFQIRTDSGTKTPSSTVLASTQYTYAQWSALSSGDVTVPLPCILSPDGTSKYWIYIYDDVLEQGATYYGLGLNTPRGYAGGQKSYSTDGGSTWLQNDQDMYFKTLYAKNTEDVNISVNGVELGLISNGTSIGDPYGLLPGATVDTYSGELTYSNGFNSSPKDFAAVYSSSAGGYGTAPTVINDWGWTNTAESIQSASDTTARDVVFKMNTMLPVVGLNVTATGFNNNVNTGLVELSGDGSTYATIWDLPASASAQTNTISTGYVNGNSTIYIRLSKDTTNGYIRWDDLKVVALLDTSSINETVLTYQTGTNTVNITSSGRAVSSSKDPSLMVNVSLIESGGESTLISNFSANATTGYPNDYFQFTDLTTDAPTTWNWTFGDSGISTDQNPVHQYTSVGLYDVSLNVTNSTSFNSTTKLNYINIATLPVPTVPTFTANKTYTTDPTLSVLFTITSVPPPRMTSYNLSFGDGYWSNTSSSSFGTVEHTYLNVGVVSPTLYVYNAAGEAHTTNSNMIIISDPFAYLINNPTIINYGIPSNLTLQLDNISHIDTVTVNVTYNKTALEVKNVYAATGWSQQNTIGSGFVKINLTKTDASFDVNTSAAYIQFNVTRSTGLNVSEPVNFVASSSGVIPNVSYTSGVYAFNKTYDGGITPTATSVTHTFNIYRTDTGESLSTVQVTNDYTGIVNGTAYTTTGSFTITSLWGFVNLTSYASAFYTNNLYNVELTGGTTNIYMTPYVPDNTVKLNQLYPKEVRFVALNTMTGAVIPGVGVTAVSYNATYDGTNWEAKLYGVSSAATSIQNTVMAGTTDSGGSITFPMISSNQYAMSFVNLSAGINQSLLLYPLEMEYRVWVDTSGTVNNTLSQISGTNLTVSEPNSSYVTLGMNYIDSSGLTENVTFSVVSQSNSTVMYTETITSGITTGVSADYTIQNIRGDGFIWKYVAYRSDSSILSQGAGVTMKGPNGVLVDLGLPSTGWYQWISMCCLFMLASLASQRTKQYWAVLIPVFAAIFLWFGWFTGKSTLSGIIILCVVLGAIIYMKSSLREKFGIGGPGTMLLNIIVYLLILQACVGFINGLEIWSDAGMANQAVTVVNTWTNIDITTISNTQQAAGLVGTIVATGTIFVDMALTALSMFGAIMFSLVTIYPTVSTLFPWMLQSTQTIALLAMLQIGIYVLYVFFIYQTWYKPTIGTADF